MLKKILLNNFILLLILSSIWGSSFLAIKIAVKTINPISIASFRLIIGTIVLAFFFYFSNNKLNLSSIVKKCESIKANNGAVDNNNPAKDELIYISDQDIKIKGIKFPSKAVKKI